MGTVAKLVGNVLTAPALKHISVNGESRLICELRVMSSSYRQTDDGPEQIDKKTYPVSITIWQEYLAQSVFDHVKVGMSVTVEGLLYVSPYIDENGAPQAGVRIEAESVAVNLRRIEQISLKPRSSRDASGYSRVPQGDFPSPNGDPSSTVNTDEAPPILRDNTKASRKPASA
ncbi:hypothetical protein WM40_26455 [Robbsia andropogonis]|uniref:Single-stranded DNA-binding protein n=1 Tax=Robbsia andropogonis TaxID=28092 RepID=A0A0F5JSS3_9BURK|nr:single-stranded DNA-binding protein [Robbsia andropogonis]KKB60901.1 hypothetical protein WM40_26455 [Robbsia andropogonis]